MTDDLSLPESYARAEFSVHSVSISMAIIFAIVSSITCMCLTLTLVNEVSIRLMIIKL